tara:strand:+ start:431 stop:862 length:432 start_codon:yes stop_codon:yes gene_type:complete
VVYVIKDSQGEKVWNMFNSYRQWCDNYRRKGFDVFRRFQRCTFELDGEHVETTIAQLNFIVWYDLYKVYDWLQENAPAVNADMQRTHQEHRATKNGGANEPIFKKRRRNELVAAPLNDGIVNVTRQERVLIFDAYDDVDDDDE